MGIEEQRHLCKLAKDYDANGTFDRDRNDGSIDASLMLVPLEIAEVLEEASALGIVLPQACRRLERYLRRLTVLA